MFNSTKCIKYYILLRDCFTFTNLLYIREMLFLILKIN